MVDRLMTKSLVSPQSNNFTYNIFIHDSMYVQKDVAGESCPHAP